MEAKKTQPAWFHLEELRQRILFSFFAFVLCSIGTFTQSQLFINIFTRSVGDLVLISPLEFFITKIKVSLFVGFYLSLPVHFFQVWKFIIPACKDHERRYLNALMIFSFFMFCLGSIFSLQTLLPIALNFLLNPTPDHIQPFISFSSYMAFVFKLTIASGLFFLFPLVVYLSVYCKLIEAEFLEDRRSYVILLIFLFSALLTPPDVISQILLGLPTYLLFELSLLLSKYFSPKKLKNTGVSPHL